MKQPRLSVLLFVVALAASAAAQEADRLAAGFQHPPETTRPQTFWHWMNGNVTADGITRDLEAMQRVGVGGAMIFDGSTYLPAGPAGYLEPHWRELMTHAIREGNRLGLEIGMHNAPGWSSSGGPWVSPAQAMQQLVWTETTVQGGRRVETDLAQPQVNLGYYRDIFVVAFPALPAEAERYEDALAHVTLGGREVSAAALSDGRLDTTVRLDASSALLLEFKAETALHALTVQPSGRGSFPPLQVEASSDGRHFTPIATVANPGRHGILAPAVRGFAAVRARWVRVTTTADSEIAEFVLHRTPRIPDWVAKANFDYRVSGQLAVPPPAPADAIIAPRSVVDLSARVQHGRLTWEAPSGAWTILRVGYTPTGKENVAASAAGRGLEIDKMNAAATEYHFDQVVKTVLADAATAGAKGPVTMAIDSYEAGMQNWTADFPEEFRRRAGYELWPYAPALFGRFVGDAAVAERFLYDFRRVQADLVAERYYGRLGELARANGLRFYAEGYGSGNFDELRVSGLADVPMGEFWVRTPWTPNRNLKMVTSAAHVYGKPVVGAEAFTGEAQTSRWLDYPYALKALGDEMFARGLNLMVFHRYVHQPHPDAVPGLALGPYGFAFERTNTWFAQAGAWIDYLRRTQFLLQQGLYAADVLYYTGERSPDPSQMALPVLPAGYDYDLVNTDVLLHRVSVRDGAYVLPEGGRYRLLVLPPELKAMRPELVRKIAEFVAAGGAVLGPKPQFSPTLDGYPSSEQEMLKVADALWDPARRGPGVVLAGGTIGEALTRLGVAPDFTFTASPADAALSWEHRRLPEGDLYFLGNRQRYTREVLASFRGMAGRQPEIWRLETGARQVAPLFRTEQDRLLLPVTLDPAESVVVLFRHPAGAAIPALERDGQQVSTTAAPLPARTGPAPAGSFTMAMWVKPDTDLRVMPQESTAGRIDEVGKFYAIPADPGDLRFGPGHATAGLAVGRNGVFVVERSAASCPAVLVSDTKVSGWTHVAVVYRAGQPRLYVNGAFVRAGLVSGRVVHSGVGSPPPPVDYVLNFPAIEALTRAAGQPPPAARGQVFQFEGNSVPPEEFPRALDDQEIAALAARGVPVPPLPVTTELSRRADGRIEVLAWQSGNFSVGGGAVAAAVPAPATLGGPWKVDFEAGRGAPASVVLPELQSLHLHPDPGVKYFSGTASYTHALDVPATFLRPGRRVVLDLGRVEVMADVWVNGRRVGNAWKEPYRLDVTDAVRAGPNTLEVRVATLWANRLIGDEQLPAEDEFGLRDERGNDPHGIVRLPDWYRAGKPKPPGGRVTFAAWRYYEKDEPLVASGLLGPVRLLNPERVIFLP